MNKKIFATRRIPDIGIKMLQDAGYTVDVYSKDEIISREELLENLANENYDAVLCLLTDKIDKEVFDIAPSIKLYANYATGFDNIDLIEAAKRGILVTNAPGDLTAEAVAEHTIALMFSLTTRIVEADEFVRQGKYKGWAPMNFIGTDILGKTLGLIGAGKIGEKVAHYCTGLGMKIIYTDVKRNEGMEKDCNAVYIESTDEVLKNADVISLHVPLMPSTHHLINESRLSIMKPTSFLINTSRGSIVDEIALEKVLKDKRIAGAALDVFEHEPMISDGLRKLQNIVLTPHIASASIEARNQMAEITAQNIIDFLEGGVPKNIVSI